MWPFKDKKPSETVTVTRDAPTNAAARTGTQGGGLVVNPGENLQIERLKGRIRRIRKALEQDTCTPEKEQALRDSLRRYEVTLILKQGGTV